MNQTAPRVLSWQRYGTICALRGLGRPALASVLKDTSKQDTYTSCRDSSRYNYIHQERVVGARRRIVRAAHGVRYTFISATHADASTARAKADR